MSGIDCGGDWLVELADQTLAADLETLAQQHVSACPRCRRELAALVESRSLLESYFAVAGSEPAGEAVSLRSARRGRQPVAVGAAALGAVALAAAVLAVVFMPRQEVVVQHSPPIVRPEPVADEQSMDDIFAEIAREEQIARVRAVIQIMEDEGLTERRAVLEEYLHEQYGVAVKEPAAM